jgi:sugar/nucleoside kinase (ribokinase family)
VAVGQIARDLVLRVEAVPDQGRSTAVTERLEILGGKGANQAAGQDGNALVWPGGSLVIPLADGPVIDTTGAGDAFVAALVAGLAHGLGPAESGQKAAAARYRGNDTTPGWSGPRMT